MLASDRETYLGNVFPYLTQVKDLTQKTDFHAHVGVIFNSVKMTLQALSDTSISARMVTNLKFRLEGELQSVLGIIAMHVGGFRPPLVFVFAGKSGVARLDLDTCMWASIISFPIMATILLIPSFSSLLISLLNSMLLISGIGNGVGVLSQFHWI